MDFQPHPVNTSLVLDDGNTSCFQDESSAEMPEVHVGKVDGGITRNKILAGTAVTAYTEATLGWLSLSGFLDDDDMIYLLLSTTFSVLHHWIPIPDQAHMWVLQKPEVSCSTLSTFPTMFLYDLRRVVVLIPGKGLPRLVTAPHVWIAGCQASKSKTVFTKYIESVLARCAKIRTLISDLQRNYEDPLAVQFLDNTFKWYCVPKQTKKEIGSLLNTWWFVLVLNHKCPFS